MTKIVRKVVYVMISILLVLGSSTNSLAQISVPEKVRIGIFYGNSGVNLVNISAQDGINMGFFKNDKFSLFLEEKTNKNVTIRKDSYFIEDNNAYVSYDISKGTGQTGEKIGPYHVQIGGNYNDLKSAEEQVSKIKQKGIEAYVSFVDVWQVWSGFYVDENLAKSGISNMQKKLGEGTYKLVIPAANRIVINSADGSVSLLFGSSTGVFQVYPKSENNSGVLSVNGKNYRGSIEIRRFEDSDMTIINTLPIEEYLYGVVPCEIEASSPIEAIKAQAVAARTYTIGNMGKFKKWEFDLCNSTYCQVYKGFDAENSSTTKAVEDTKGKKLTYKGELAQVFYFSSSGGKTEDVKNVWGSSIPYLVSVEDPYESGKSWNYNWETTLENSEITTILTKNDIDIGNVISIEASKYSESGRVIELVIHGTKGDKVYTNGSTRNAFSLNSQMYRVFSNAHVAIRNSEGDVTNLQLSNKKVYTSAGLKIIDSNNSQVTVLGANDNMKNVSMTPTGYTFKGKGWGHGVGLSQEGAKGLALVGFNYEKILQHYFTGTEVK